LIEQEPTPAVRTKVPDYMALKPEPVYYHKEPPALVYWPGDKVPNPSQALLNKASDIVYNKH